MNYCGGGLLRCGRWVVFGLSGFLLVGFLAACSTAPDTKAETEVMIQRQQAVDYASQGDQNMVSRNFAQAEVFYQQSLQANWATDNLAGVIQAHFSLGFLYLGLGFADRADEEYVGAAEAAAMLGDPGLIADCQLNRAKIELWRSQPQAALDRLEAASKALGRDANDQDGGRRATFLHNRGQALKDLGRMTEAKADLTAALAINLKNKRLKEPAANLYLLASIANRENKLDEALDLAGRALTLDKQAENSEGIAKDLYAMATLLQKYPGKDGQPRLTEAWDLLRRSYRVSLATNDAVAVERDLVLLQELAGKLGLVEEQSRYAAAAAKLKASQAAAAKGGTGAAGPTATPSPSPSTGKVK